MDIPYTSKQKLQNITVFVLPPDQPECKTCINSDFTYRVEKITNSHYKVELPNHDGKENFEIKIRKVS